MRECTISALTGQRPSQTILPKDKTKMYEDLKAVAVAYNIELSKEIKHIFMALPLADQQRLLVGVMKGLRLDQTIRDKREEFMLKVKFPTDNSTPTDISAERAIAELRNQYGHTEPFVPDSKAVVGHAYGAGAIGEFKKTSKMIMDKLLPKNAGKPTEEAEKAAAKKAAKEISKTSKTGILTAFRQTAHTIERASTTSKASPTEIPTAEGTGQVIKITG